MYEWLHFANALGGLIRRTVQSDGGIRGVKCVHHGTRGEALISGGMPWAVDTWSTLLSAFPPADSPRRIPFGSYAEA